MAAISSDPDKVVKFFTELSKNLYNAINDKMASTDLSSALTIYNDKEMASQYSDYKDKVSTWEKKLLIMKKNIIRSFQQWRWHFQNCSHSKIHLQIFLEVIKGKRGIVYDKCIRI